MQTVGLGRCERNDASTAQHPVECTSPNLSLISPNWVWTCNEIRHSTTSPLELDLKLWTQVFSWSSQFDAIDSQASCSVSFLRIFVTSETCYVRNGVGRASSSFEFCMDKFSLQKFGFLKCFIFAALRSDRVNLLCSTELQLCPPWKNSSNNFDLIGSRSFASDS